MKSSTLFAALAVFLFAFAPARADWTLASGSAGNTTMSDGTHTLKVTVLDATARTIRIGQRGTADGYNQKYNSNANGNQNAGWVLDFSSPITLSGGTDTYTIVEIGSYAFYNNKQMTCPPTGLDLTTVTNIGNGAFGFATGLTKVLLGNKLERVGAAAFMSNYGNSGFSPQLPPSLKVVEMSAFGHHVGKDWDKTSIVPLTGEVELRGIETLQRDAFTALPYLTKVVLGPNLTSFGVAGTAVNDSRNNGGVFQYNLNLRAVEWLGPPPTTGVPSDTFKTGSTSYTGCSGTGCVTNYVYVEYFDAWTNSLNSTGLTVGSLLSGNDPAGVDPAEYDLTNPAVYQLASSTGSIYLSLLPDHKPVEGAPVFNSVPTMTQSGNAFTFRANMDEGDGCDLFAVFTALDGTAVTNTLATGVDGDPDTFYTLAPTGLAANKTYSFAVLGTKDSAAVTRAGVGTFFNGEISVAAPADFSENGGSGSFTFSRSGTDGDVTVPFALSGTASEFDNFRELPRSVTIPDGSSSAMVPVAAVVNLASGDKTLALTTDTASLFFVDQAAASATATITDWTPPAKSSFAQTRTYSVTGYDETRATLANFPVLVRIPSGLVADSTQMAFYDESGTFLPFEIDTWDASGESTVWVGVPSLAQGGKIVIASDLVGYASPDLAPALWRTSGYVAVLHLGEDGPDFAGSTVQGVDGTGMLTDGSSAGSANQVEGAVGSARLIDSGSGSGKARIAVDNFESYLDDMTRMTISFWAKHRSDVSPANGERLFGNKTATQDQVTGLNAWLNGATAAKPIFSVMGNPTLAKIARLDVSILATPQDDANISWSDTWTHFSLSFAPTTDPTYFHVGGVRVKHTNNQSGGTTQSTSFAPLQSNGDVPLSFGNSYDEGGSATSFKGSMDEIRVRNGSVSDDWAFAENATVTNECFLVLEEPDDPDLIDATFVVDPATVTTNAAAIVGTLTTASTNGCTSAWLYFAYAKASEALPERTLVTNAWEQGTSITNLLLDLERGTTYNASFVVSNANDFAKTYNLSFTTSYGPAAVFISEVGSAVTDPWGNTSSFIELYNASTAPVDLAGYTIKRYQKGKFGKTDIVFPSHELASNAYVVVWCSDDNGYDVDASLVDGVFRSGAYKLKASNTPKIYLYDATGAEKDTFQVLAGLADGKSMGPSADFDGVNIYYFKKVTPGAANNYSGATAIGPTFDSTTHSADEVALDADLGVSSTWTPLEGSTVTNVTMYYRLAFSNEVAVAMTDSGDGLTWTSSIPSAVYADAAPGSLVRWRFVATDSLGRTTKEPAFGSADGSPEYYGTITAPGFTSDLPVFHLFVAATGVGSDLADDPTDDPRNLAAMDIDSDALASTSGYTDMDIGARCSIYHNGHLYDNVTIDLRGNTSAGFQKKSHGLKFNKTDKLAYTDPYTGAAGTVRKTSFTSEFMDPSFLRQNVAFRFMNAVGVKAPFHYPVRLQRNAEFYQLGFHSIRFTDEILDYYGWDEDCELVKNSGSLRTTSSTAGFETKVPELDDESQATDNFKALVSALTSDAKSTNAWDILDIPKWINYMAATRITHEMDDVWGNLCSYLHNETSTWWPGAYDMNLSFGQYYREGGWTSQGLPGEIADEDTFKSHPLYGGSQVRMYNKGTTSLFTGGGSVNYNYNGAFDAIYGDELLRGMHLRRLRTLMDAYLKEPGTAAADTPLWQYFASQTNAMYETACLDRAKWTNIGTGDIINPWGSGKFYTNIVEGAQSVWDNYIVPRRVHLYETHSAAAADYDSDNVFTEVADGSVVCHNAGIPDSQPANLSVSIARRIVDEAGTNTYIKIDNRHSIFLDVSGWTVSNGVDSATLEPGTVIPPMGALYLVADRKAFTAAHPLAQVLLEGNVPAALVSDGESISVTDAAGFVAAVLSRPAGAPAGETITEAADEVGPVFEIETGSVACTNASFNAAVLTPGPGAQSVEAVVQVSTAADFSTTNFAAALTLSNSGTEVVSVFGLATNATYYARVFGTNDLGQAAVSDAVAFTTGIPTAPEATGAVASVGFTNLVANVTVTNFGAGAESAWIRLEASEDSSFASLAASAGPVAAEALDTIVPFSLAGLVPAKTYHVRAVVSNAWGLVSTTALPDVVTPDILTAKGVGYAFDGTGSLVDISFIVDDIVTNGFEGIEFTATLTYNGTVVGSKTFDAAGTLTWRGIAAATHAAAATVRVTADFGDGKTYARSWRADIRSGSSIVEVSSITDHVSSLTALRMHPGDIAYLPEIAGTESYEIGNTNFLSLDGTKLTALRPGIVGVRHIDSSSATNTMAVLVLPDPISGGDIYVFDESRVSSDNWDNWDNPTLWEKVGSDVNDSYPHLENDIAIIPLYDWGTIHLQPASEFALCLAELYAGRYVDESGTVNMRKAGNGPNYSGISFSRTDGKPALVQLSSNHFGTSNFTSRVTLQFSGSFPTVRFLVDTTWSGGWDGRDSKYPQGRFSWGSGCFIPAGVTVSLVEMDTEGVSYNQGTVHLDNLSGAGTFWNHSSGLVRYGSGSSGFTGLIRDSGGHNANGESQGRSGPAYFRSTSLTNASAEVVGWVFSNGQDPSYDYRKGVGALYTGYPHFFGVDSPHLSYFPARGTTMHGGLIVNRYIGSGAWTNSAENSITIDAKRTDSLNVACGFNYIYADGATGAPGNVFIADALAHGDKATLRITDTSRYSLASSEGNQAVSNVLHGVSSFAVGAGGDCETSSAYSVVPWIVGPVANNGTTMFFACFDGEDRLVRPANASDDASAALSTWGATDNAVMLKDYGIALESDKTLNSLVLNTSGLSTSDQRLGAGRTLTITSGGLCLSNSASDIGTEDGGEANGTLVLGDAEHPGYVWARGSDSSPNEIWASVTAPGGFVHAYTGTLILGGAQTNIADELVVNAGTLQLGTASSVCDLQKDLGIRVFANATLRLPNATSTRPTILRFDGAAGWFGKIEIPEGVTTRCKKVFWRDYPETPEWQSLPRGRYSGDAGTAAGDAEGCTYDPVHFSGAGILIVTTDNVLDPTLILVR